MDHFYHGFNQDYGTYEPFPNMMAAPVRIDSLTDYNQHNPQLSLQSGFEAGKFRTYPGNATFDPNFNGGMSLPTNQQSSPIESACSPGSEPQKLPKVAIPRASVSNGPMSRHVEIPARPRPGRKPMVEDTDDKRKTQNRHAQRAFRDRRAQKVQILEGELEAQKAALARQQDEHRRQMQMKNNELEQKNNEILHLKDALARLQSQISMPSMGNEQAYTAVPTPPEDDSHDTQEMETDFTAMFAKPKPQPFSSLADEDQTMGDSPIGGADHCGFCTRPDNCLCRQEEEQSQTLPPISEQRVTLPLPTKTSSAPSYLEAPTRASGPGSCDMCLADPEKARQCQEMARATQFATKQQSSSSTRSGSLGDDRMSCSDFLTTARQKNVQLGPDVYGRMQHVYPYAHRSGVGSSHSPAMEIDAHDAAHALAEMSRGVGSKEGLTSGH